MRPKVHAEKREKIAGKDLEKQLKVEQLKLAKKLILKDSFKRIKLIAGVDPALK